MNPNDINLMGFYFTGSKEGSKNSSMLMKNDVAFKSRN